MIRFPKTSSKTLALAAAVCALAGAMTTASPEAEARRGHGGFHRSHHGFHGHYGRHWSPVVYTSSCYWKHGRKYCW